VSVPVGEKRRNMMMSRKFALITVLSLLVTHPTMASADIVDLALQSIGGGSVTEMRSHMLSMPFCTCEPEDIRRAVASLPSSIRQTRVSEGKLFRRVENIIRPVLELHGRGNKIELFLHEDHVPKAMVWQRCILIISDSLAHELNDEELAGIVAHEMGHAYFMIEIIKARNYGDMQAMKIVELKCDAVAMLSLKLLGHDPADHLRGLLRIDDHIRRDGYTRLSSRDHPSMVERTQFAQRFLKLLA
jgi:hypothetical protein